MDRPKDFWSICCNLRTCYFSAWKGWFYLSDRLMLRQNIVQILRKTFEVNVVIWGLIFSCSESFFFYMSSRIDTPKFYSVRKGNLPTFQKYVTPKLRGVFTWNFQVISLKHQRKWTFNTMCLSGIVWFLRYKMWFYWLFSCADFENMICLKHF